MCSIGFAVFDLFYSCNCVFDGSIGSFFGVCLLWMQKVYVLYRNIYDRRFRLKNPLSSGDKTPKTIEPEQETTTIKPTQMDLDTEDTQEIPPFSQSTLREDQDTLLLELEKLTREETSLREEKSTLFTFREQLKKKILDEMELRKRNINLLKDEVASIKAECEGLVKVVNSSVTASALPK